MKLKDIEDSGIFTCWTITNKFGEKIAHYCDKKCLFKHYVNEDGTCTEKYNKYKDCEVLSIYDMDIDRNFENNYITVKLNVD